MVSVESQTFQVRNGRNRHHLIPYIGNKSGFVRIFDRLIPKEVVGKREIVDAFGGSGAFSIYACYRFGSEKVTYNDNNPVVVNFLRHVQSSPKNSMNSITGTERNLAMNIILQYAICRLMTA